MQPEDLKFNFPEERFDPRGHVAEFVERYSCRISKDRIIAFYAVLRPKVTIAIWKCQAGECSYEFLNKPTDSKTTMFGDFIPIGESFVMLSLLHHYTKTYGDPAYVAAYQEGRDAA